MFLSTVRKPRVNKYSCSNILLKGAIYHFRQCIPQDIVPCFSKKEYRLSLHTSDKRKAARKAAIMHNVLWDIFTLIREDGFKMDEATFRNIEAMADKWLVEILKDDELKRIKGLVDHAFWHVDKDFNYESNSYDFDSMASMVQSDIKEALKTNDFKPFVYDTNTGEYSGVYGIKKTVDDFITTHALDIKGEELIALTREIAKRYVDYLEIGKARENGDYAVEKKLMKDIFPSSGTNISSYTCAKALPLQDIQDDSDVTILEAVNKYYETKRFKDLAAGTQTEARRALTDFTSMLGNIPLKDISVASVRTFRARYYKMPKERRTKERVHLNASQLIALAENDPTVQIRTERASCKSLAFIVTFFKWLEKEGYCFNPQIIKVIAPDKEKPLVNANEKRNRYTIEELNRMFHHKSYVSDSFRYDFQFWLPLLGIFTGAILDELCQINPQDGILQSKEGIWYIDIKDNAEGKGIKTAAGYRAIPIHPELIALGFIKYAEGQKAKGETLLFPELRNRRADKKLYPKASRWFNDVFKKEVGITSVATKTKKEEKKLDFHSFRATFIDTAKQLSLPLSQVHEIVGHTEDRGVTGIYEERYGIAILFHDVIEKIKYDGLDLSKLKNNRYSR